MPRLRRRTVLRFVRVFRPRCGSAAVALAGLMFVGCAGRESSTGGPMTEIEKNATIRKAIRSSSEGVIFLPSRKAQAVFELPRLNEIAQWLRQPAAACFLQRAVETMEVAPGTDEGFTGVPDGQVKLRARIGPDGTVLRTEVLETGFDDDVVPKCVAKAVRTKRFPENTTGNAHYIDIIYWVSLGMATDMSSPQMRERMRKETVKAAIRAKPCITGRVRPGSYTVEGLNLVGPDGSTMANRVDQSSLPNETRSCVARAFREIRLPADKDSFVRPMMPTIRFDVGDDGVIAVQDEDWFRVLRLEERAQRAQKQADLGAKDGVRRDPPKYIDEGEPELQTDSDGAAPRSDSDGAAPRSDSDSDSEAAASDAKRNPGQGGLKIDLGTRPGS